MIHFAKVDEAARQIADAAAARRETEVRQHFEPLYGAMRRRLLQAARRDLVDDLAVLALVARTLFPETTTPGEDDFHGIETRYDELHKPRLVHEYLEVALWLRGKAEAALRRLHALTAVSARDHVGLPIFDPPSRWHRVPEPIKVVLAAHFLRSTEDPEGLRWLR